MKIKRVHLKNHKRFYDLTIDLTENPAKIVALVGKNGCGKSSVFDAFLYKQNAYERIGNTNSFKNDYYSLNNMQYDYNNIDIEFEDTKFAEKYAELKKLGRGKTIFSFRSPFRYNGNLNVNTLESIGNISENLEGASSTSDIDQRIAKNYSRLFSKYLEELNLHEQDMTPANIKLNIIGELNKHINNCLDISIYNLGNIVSGHGTLFFIRSDNKIPFEYKLLSSGEKEVVDLLLDLYLRRDKFCETIYLFDEPELHLNTSIQRKLLKSIVELIPNKSQIWVATHSIGFLRALQQDYNNESQVLYFEDEKEWSIKPYVITPMIKNRESWIKIFSTALDDLSQLISPKTIVYCEGEIKPNGQGNENGIDAIVYNTIFNKNYPDVCFVSSGGSTEPDIAKSITFKIISKIDGLKELQLLVLKDRDCNSGKEVTDDERNKKLTNNPDLRLLKRWEIENYLFDKEILMKYCDKNNYNFNNELYESLISDINLDNVKDIIQQIKKTCGLGENYSVHKWKIDLASLITSETNVYKELESIIFY